MEVHPAHVADPLLREFIRQFRLLQSILIVNFSTIARLFQTGQMLLVAHPLIFRFHQLKPIHRLALLIYFNLKMLQHLMLLHPELRLLQFQAKGLFLSLRLLRLVR